MEREREGGKNRSWFYGGRCSEIRAVQGFDKSPHEPLSLCNAGKQAIAIYPEQMNSSSVILSWTTLNYCGPDSQRALQQGSSQCSVRGRG